MTGLRRIGADELRELGRTWHMELGRDEVEQLGLLAEDLLGVLDPLAASEKPAADPVPAEREVGPSPSSEQDPLNAIVRFCRVRAHGAGSALAGMRVAIKDSMAIAGLPMTLGSTVITDFVPDVDAVVIERLLRAGAELVAITNMDHFAFSGGGDSSSYGPTLNPFDRTRTAGGSSGGSAAALWYDGIDAALGTDQGGSIRVPAAWCGVVGVKPTHSLVPYTGIAGIDATFDHAGPMTRTVQDAARLLGVIAGRHPSDPRQAAGVPVDEYVRKVEEAPRDLRGLRIGLVAEGFSPEIGTDPAVADAVRGAAARFGELGADVRELSLPEHLTAAALAFAGFIEGMTALMTGGGNGYAWAGRYWPELAEALGEGLRERADLLSPQMKVVLIVGEHLRRRHSGAVYARGQNLRPALVAAYDSALEEVDLLLMPTTPGPPHPVAPELSVRDRVMRGWTLLANTTPTDMTGHPSLSIPAAEANGLPAGVMLVGRRFDDARLLAVARTYEREVGWSPGSPPPPA